LKRQTWNVTNDAFEICANFDKYVVFCSGVAVPFRRISGRKAYTRAMSRIAEEVRNCHEERVMAMAPAERFEMALSLGWQELEMFRRAEGISREQALRILRAQRQEGRTPCSFLGEGA